MHRTALVTGVTGQDGSYLAELLTSKGYDVVGLSRGGRPAVGAVAGVEYRRGDAGEDGLLHQIVHEVEPSEIYHLAGESTVARMSESADALSNAARALVHVLDAAREWRKARVLLASSSEIFGVPATSPQNEETEVAPINSYGAVKAFALHLGRSFRNEGLGVSTAILFNHESPRRPPAFVTRKITRGVADIVAGRAKELWLGNLEARRDWGFAGDYVEAMWLMLQSDEAADYVVGSGVSHSVREFCEAAFQAAGLDYRDYVRSDPSLVRKVDAVTLEADASRARARLGWSPRTDFSELVAAMVSADLGQ